MTVPLLGAGIAAAISLASTPFVRRLAVLGGMTDLPDARRVHSVPTPRGGGVAVAVGVAVAFALAGGAPSAPVLAGALLLLGTGIADDVLSLALPAKLSAQVLAALLAVAGGVRLDLPVTPDAVDAVLTVMWIVFITNALNLSDGLDGLAAGIGAIAFLWLAAAAVRAGDLTTAVPALVMAGALVGFLPYNINPASIFLGDSGSLVIGYATAVLPLEATARGTLTAPAAFLLTALPMTDTLLTITRRFVSRWLRTWAEIDFWRGVREGIRNVGRPDRRHIHHRLIDLGFPQRRAVPILYTVAAVTGGLAFLAARSTHWPIDLSALGLGLAAIGLVQALGIDELRLARSGAALPVLRRVIDRRGLVIGVDACLAAAAYTGALILTDRATGVATTLAAAVAMAGTAVLAFTILRVYDVAWRATGLTGLGLLLRACAAATVGGYVILRLVGLPVGGGPGLVFFAFILPAAAAMRLSYLLLAQAAESAVGPERALVCGSASGARRALARLRRRGLRNVQPVGLVELRPRWQGRRLGRLSVLGTLDGLDDILRQTGARHFVIADPAVRGDALRWARAVCRHRGVHVHRYVEKLVPFDGRVAIRLERPAVGR